MLNQKVAVASLMTISAKKDISSFVAKVIGGKAVGSRRWSAHILGNLVSKSYADQIEVMVRKERDADAKSEQIYALGQFKHKLDKATVDSFSKDKSERVRAKLMIFIAQINDEKRYIFTS